MRTVGGVLLLSVIAACSISKEVTVPAIDAAEPAATARLAGRYLAVIEGGRWRLTVVRQTGGRCAGYQFTFYADGAFEEAARTSLASLFAEIDFVAAQLSSQQLREGGYDGAIILRQGTASGDMKLLNFITQAVASLDIEVALVDAKVPAFRQQVRAEGFSSRNSEMSCSAAADIQVEAIQKAIRDAIHGTATALRARLAGMDNP